MTGEEIQRRVDAWLKANDGLAVTLGWCRVQWNIVSRRYGPESPAALGVLEHGLLPAIGYGEDAHLDCWGPAGARRWSVIYYRPDPVHLVRCSSVDEDGHPSKAEALVVALEASS